MSGLSGAASSDDDDYVPDLPPEPISTHPDGLLGEERDRVENAARHLVRESTWLGGCGSSEDSRLHVS